MSHLCIQMNYDLCWGGGQSNNNNSPNLAQVINTTFQYIFMYIKVFVVCSFVPCLVGCHDNHCCCVLCAAQLLSLLGVFCLTEVIKVGSIMKTSDISNNKQ